MTVNPARDSSIGMIPTRRLGMGEGQAGDVRVDGSVVVPPAPFWAGWVLDITYHDGTPQQVAWAEEAVQQCTYPLQALGVKIDVWFSGRPPNSDTRHPYMVTQMTASNHANIYVEPWADDPTAPQNQGLSNPVANIKEFYKESFVHELGHVVIGSTVGSALQDVTARNAREAAYAALFYRFDTRRRGTLADWDDLSLAWPDEEQEAAAETFKCAFYSEKLKLLFHNRTNWRIDESDWKSYLTLMEPGKFDVIDTFNAANGTIGPSGSSTLAEIVGHVHSQWFEGGSVFVSEDGHVFYDPSLFSGGEGLRIFQSHSSFIDSPPFAPINPITGQPFTHGWGVNDSTQTWAEGGVDNFFLLPSLPQALSRIGYAELLVTEQALSQSLVSLGFQDETGHAWGTVSYNWAFTPTGYNTFTAFGFSLPGVTPPLMFGVPLMPPCLLFVDIDANAGTVTAGVKDIGGAVVFSRTSTTLPRTHLYVPYFQGAWLMLGDDPGFPPPVGNPYSELRAGPCTWTTEPTLVTAPYPFKPPGVVPGPRSGGIILLN